MGLFMRICLDVIVAISAVVGFVASSCGKTDAADSVITVVADDAVPARVGDLLESLEVIPLEFNTDKYPHGVKSIIATDSIFIVFDNENIVYVYGNDGKYISDSANKIGRGAGEYSIVTAMAYNRYADFIEIATPANLLFYDREFNLVKKSKLPTKNTKNGFDGMFYGFIHDISSHEHLLIPEGILDDNRKIILYDSETNKVVYSVSYEKEVIADVTMQSDCFHNISENELAFFPPGITNYIYSYNLNTQAIEKAYRIDYGSDGIAEYDLRSFSDDKERLKYEIMNTDKTLPLKTMHSGNRIIIVYKDGKSMKNIHTLLWNVESGNGYIINSYTDGELSFPVVDYCDNDILYSVVDSENLSQFISEIDLAKLKMPQYSIPEGSLAILCYKLKECI